MVDFEAVFYLSLGCINIGSRRLIASASYIILQIKFIVKQRVKPKTVGIIADKRVYLMLPVSFFIVNRVVKQGEWKRVNTKTHMAVDTPQPF